MLKLMEFLRSVVNISDNTVWSQFVRYLIVGAFATVVDVSTLVFLTECVQLHLISAAAGFMCGVVTNYLLSIRFVFRHRTLSSKGMEFVFFAIIGAIGLAWNQLIMYIATDVVRMDYRVSKLFAVVMVLVWNFGARKLLLFRETRA